jgi:uncharacterized membrane protein YhaH (DUF805 family)
VLILEEIAFVETVDVLKFKSKSNKDSFFGVILFELLLLVVVIVVFALLLAVIEDVSKLKSKSEFEN